MDIFDMFGDQEENYRGSLWLYNTTQGIVALGPKHGTIEEAQAALEAYSELELTWTHETIDDGIDHYASKAYEEAFNVAVVLRVENGDLVSRAPIEDGWLPPGDPRRGPRTPSPA